MALLSYYLQYVSEICEGTRSAPAGIVLRQEEPVQRALELHRAAQEMGIDAFVRACADADGTQIAREEYDSFDPNEFAAAVEQFSAPPQEQTPESEIRDIYEVFLDSILLDDKLMRYLIDVALRNDQKEFETLSRAAARTVLSLEDFMAWLGNKELLAGEEERDCAARMDACMERLRAEGKLELLAALLSADEKTYCAFRTGAPELCDLPNADYEWFCKNYADRYYPVRFIMRFNGVRFPKAKI